MNMLKQTINYKLEIYLEEFDLLLLKLAEIIL